MANIFFTEDLSDPLTRYDDLELNRRFHFYATVLTVLLRSLRQTIRCSPDPAVQSILLDLKASITTARDTFRDLYSDSSVPSGADR